MSLAHLHLVLVHIPVVGIPMALLLLVAGLYFSKRDLVTAALIGSVLMGALSVPAYLTGESAEKLVEQCPRFSEQAVEEHEEQGERAFIATEIFGAMALLTILFRQRKKPYGFFVAGTLLTGLLASGLLLLTANLGGRISHQEIFAPKGLTAPCSAAM